LPHVTICPPAPEPQSLHYAAHQFEGDHLHAVHAVKTAEGWNTTGIAFEDYTRFNIRRRKPSNERKQLTPEWALSADKTREVLVNFIESRAGILKRARVGTLRERLTRAQNQLQLQRKDMDKTLTGLCHEYHSQSLNRHSDKVRLHILAVEIEVLDTRLRMTALGPGAVLRMIYLYYKVRLNSVGVAAEIGMKPPHCRTTLSRLNEEWRDMQAAPAAEPDQRLRPVTSKRMRDLTGQRFGRLLVRGLYIKNDKYGCPLWLCICNCGKEKLACTSHLNSSTIRSCGCMVKEITPRCHRPLIDVTGQTFGRLTVVRRAHAKAGEAAWLCRCTCGRMKVAESYNLRSGDTNSCGCLRIGRKAVVT